MDFCDLLTEYLVEERRVFKVGLKVNFINGTEISVFFSDQVSVTSLTSKELARL